MMLPENFKECCEEGLDLFREKNAAYGDSIEECGLLGVAVELISIAGRLKQLVLRNPRHGRDAIEQLENVLIDAHNYGSIAMYMLRTKNWEGK